MALQGSLIVFIGLFGCMVSAEYFLAPSEAPYVVRRLIQRRAVPSSAPVVSAANVQDQQAAIVSYGNEFNPADGSFSYGYEQTNGISNKAKGYMRDGKQVIEGSYSLVTKDGVPVSITYFADENGYNAVGDAIPTPHPAIVKALDYLRSLPPSHEDEKA